MNKDIGLQGNEKIEGAIATLQKEPTEKLLAHTLTVLRGLRQNPPDSLPWTLSGYAAFHR